MKNRLFQSIDNAPLIVFRIFLGLLLALESFGSILTGWVKNVYVAPKFFFQHIGFEWLQPLPGYGMYYYYAIMGILGLCIMAGYRYRWTLSLFTLLWTGVYLMQKTSYNNHYYLLILVCLMMIFLPANRYASLDVRRNPKIRSLTMPRWCSVVMIAMVAILYFYATVSKLYPDWLDGTFTKNLLQGKTDIPFFKALFNTKAFYLFIAYAGIAFDLLIVPMLLWRKTRNFALVASLIFHLFNAVTLQIGIFPFFALSFALFFYPPDTIRKIFLRKKPVAATGTPDYQHQAIVYYFFIPFLFLQLVLPLRHYAIKGDVLWTEEGHRLSWRMMLRSRRGYCFFKVVDKETQEATIYNLQRNLLPKQVGFVSDKPDGIWQMAQHIKKEYQKRGIDVAVYADSKISINGSPYKTFIDPEVDLATAKWDYFFHNDWILLYDKQGNRLP